MNINENKNKRKHFLENTTRYERILLAKDEIIKILIANYIFKMYIKYYRNYKILKRVKVEKSYEFLHKGGLLKPNEVVPYNLISQYEKLAEDCWYNVIDEIYVLFHIYRYDFNNMHFINELIKRIFVEPNIKYCRGYFHKDVFGIATKHYLGGLCLYNSNLGNAMFYGIIENLPISLYEHEFIYKISNDYDCYCNAYIAYDVRVLFNINENLEIIIPINIFNFNIEIFLNKLHQKTCILYSACGKFKYYLRINKYSNKLIEFKISKTILLKKVY